MVKVDDLDRNPPRCPLHPFKFQPKKRYDHHYHQGKAIYTSSRWLRLREQYVAQNPLCEDCLSRGIVTEGNDVDHIVEIKDGGDPFDIKNLRHLCTSCHRHKTGQEMRKRRNKKQLNGFRSLSDF